MRRAIATQFLISADPKHHTGPRLYFTRKKFSDHGSPARFPSLAAAKQVARYLIGAFATLKEYRVRIEGVNATSRHTVGVWNMNPLGLLSLLEGGSAASSLARQKNPSKRREITRAAKLLKSFSGHTPGEVLRVKQVPIKRGLVIGSLDGVPYTTIRDGKTEHYLHEFGENARPLLIASSDGRRLGIVGGRFQFTEAGIIDT